MVVKECVRTKTAESDRQFCFDLDLTSQDASEMYIIFLHTCIVSHSVIVALAHLHTHTHTHTHSHKYTVQATSSRNRKGWLEIMDGKEPVYSSLNDVGSKLQSLHASCYYFYTVYKAASLMFFLYH